MVERPKVQESKLQTLSKMALYGIEPPVSEEHVGYNHAQIPLCSNARRSPVCVCDALRSRLWKSQTRFADGHIPATCSPASDLQPQASPKSDRPELNWRFHVGNVTSYHWTTVAWRREVAGARQRGSFEPGERPHTSGLTIGTGENRTHITALRERCSTTELQCRCISKFKLSKTGVRRVGSATLVLTTSRVIDALR